jgi:hypothetical protein
MAKKMINTLSKTYFEAATDASDCSDCYFKGFFKEWLQAEVLKIHRRD